MKGIGPPYFLKSSPWKNDNLYLFHGTLDIYAKSIRKGVDVERGRDRRDFGRGFYTTTIKRQARAWAWQSALDYNDARSRSEPEVAPVVFSFQVDRNDLAGLQCLSFARADHNADDFWRFVQHCRAGAIGHARHVYHPRFGEWYDIVIGPVAAFWRTRLAIVDSDQVSFHTGAGAQLLNRSPRRMEKVAWS